MLFIFDNWEAEVTFEINSSELKFKQIIRYNAAPSPFLVRQANKIRYVTIFLQIVTLWELCPLSDNNLQCNVICKSTESPCCIT